MKLSTKARYGARLMLDLALHYGEGPQLLKDIASRQEVSEKYLWQLITPLKAARVVNSSRGAHGGYTLARQPSEVTLRDIVETLEGPLCIVECVDNPSVCNRAKTCVTRDIWGEASDKLRHMFESITLQDMIKRQKEKNDLS
jgi:Rrf2 family protein